MNWITKWFKKPEPEIEVEKPKPTRPRRTKPKLSEKELATQRGEPWVNILKIDINPENLHEGAFELDWNEKFVANLVRAGYQMSPNDTDADIVDRWFQNVCRHVVLETFEQYEAMLPESSRVIKRKNLGDGFSEAS